MVSSVSLTSMLTKSDDCILSSAPSLLGGSANCDISESAITVSAALTLSLYAVTLWLGVVLPDPTFIYARRILKRPRLLRDTRFGAKRGGRGRSQRAAARSSTLDGTGCTRTTVCVL